MESQRSKGKRIAATNGCFDVLHIGHLRSLEAAKGGCDLLVVGINSDESVRALKGPTRPINPEAERAEMLAALEVVDAVVVFPETTAAHFLFECQPDIWAKGGDYTLETIDRMERATVEESGGVIRFVPTVAGRSTTNLLAKLGS